MSTPPPMTHDHRSDTGKEVVYDQTKQVYTDPRYDGLEVNPHQHLSSDGLEANPHQHLISDGSSEKHLPGNDTKTSRWSRKKKMVLLWTTGGLIVLITVVVATVLATMLHKKNGRSAKDDPIAPKSSLAATAWVVDQKSGSYLLRLIHQHTDGQLQSTTFDSASGKWNNVANFMSAAAGSPLALTQFNKSLYNGKPEMQKELFFINVKDDVLQEWTWDFTNTTQSKVGGVVGDASEKNFEVYPSSQIGAYWPFVIYQGSDGGLWELVYNGWNSPTKTDDWTIPMSEGGAIQIVPVQQALTRMGIFYQQKDLSIVLYERDGNNNTEKEGVYNKIAEFATPSLPPKTALAAFSLPGDDEVEYSPLKTYALYQDSDAKIQMRWRNDTSLEWRGPKTFPAFESADNGTSLACVTMYSFLKVSMVKWSVPTCFFLAGGNITQVKMVDEDWEVVGIVGVDEP